jgi:DEAD/DEAH box helicase domain-containing protein
MYLGRTTHIIKLEILKNLVMKDLDLDDKLPYYIKKLIDSRDGIGSGLHAIEHVIIKIAPIFTYVDSRELGGRSYSKYSKYPYNDKKIIFIYDANEGGVGLSEILYENAETLLEKAYKHLTNCKCEDGCPYCIYSTKCGNFNEFLDKWQAIKILETTLNNSKTN